MSVKQPAAYGVVDDATESYLKTPEDFQCVPERDHFDFINDERTAPTQFGIFRVSPIGYWQVVASDLSPEAVSIDQVDWSVKTALVLGNEERGISKSMRSLADETFAIPMRGFAQSFNLSVACSVCLAHLSAIRYVPTWAVFLWPSRDLAIDFACLYVHVWRGLRGWVSVETSCLNANLSIGYLSVYSTLTRPVCDQSEEYTHGVCPLD